MEKKDRENLQVEKELEEVRVEEGPSKRELSFHHFFMSKKSLWSFRERERSRNRKSVRKSEIEIHLRGTWI